MTDMEYKEFSDLIFELSNTLDKIEVHTSNSNNDTLNNAWVIQGLHAIRRACASITEELSADLIQKQSKTLREDFQG